MKKENSIFHLLVTALFIGILLSLAIFYLICTAFDYANNTENACLDGTQIEGDDILSRFNRAVYQNKSSLSYIREYNYLLFHCINTPNVIVGRNSFLFEVQSSTGNYNYVEDYLGQCAFDDRELAAILALLEHRKQSYAERGSDYLLVVLPNAQTVYSENMPSYLRKSDQTRLSRLETYLTENGYDAMLNMTDDLIAYKQKGLLYNTTENSLNSLGLYRTHLSVCDYLSGNLSVYVPLLTHYDFYTHRTTGKTLSQQAQLADAIPNLTVSLANANIRGYDTVYQSRYATQTALTEQEHPLGATETPSILLQFPGTWERLQAEPFFSNAFSSVTYQTNWYDDPEAFEQASPQVVVQFIYEYQLSALLSRNYYS